MNYAYKARIRKIVESDPDWTGFFRIPTGETDPLEVGLDPKPGGWKKQQADFGYEFDGGYLFIEDDNANTMKGNLEKYERWCTARPQIKNVYLIHIVGIPKRWRAQWRTFGKMELLGEEIRARLTERGIQFVYRTITHEGFDEQWNELNAAWLTDLRTVIDRIVKERRTKVLST